MSGSRPEVSASGNTSESTPRVTWLGSHGWYTHPKLTSAEGTFGIHFRANPSSASVLLFESDRLWSAPLSPKPKFLGA